MRVIITGPTGAIGMALIQKCIRSKVHVIAICHKNSKRNQNILSLSGCGEYVQLVEADLQKLLEIEQEISGNADVFYHLAWMGTTGIARNDMYLQNQNVKSTLDAVQLAKRVGCRVFIGAGSQAEYGRIEGKLCADTPTFPENGYGMAKLCAGQMSRALCEELGIKHIWVRVLSVYGPYDNENSMITGTINKLLKGEHAGFTKGEDLGYFLRELCRCKYIHCEEYAPTKEILDAYKKKHIDWDGYVSQYLPLMERHQAAKKFLERFSEYERVCLLCSEPTPERCHRRLLAELIQKAGPGISVQHL